MVQSVNHYGQRSWLLAKNGLYTIVVAYMHVEQLTDKSDSHPHYTKTGYEALICISSLRSISHDNLNKWTFAVRIQLIVVFVCNLFVKKIQCASGIRLGRTNVQIPNACWTVPSSINFTSYQWFVCSMFILNALLPCSYAIHCRCLHQQLQKQPVCTK